MCIIPTFLCPVQTLCNLDPGASSVFGINVKKQNDSGDSVELLTSFKTFVDARVESLVWNVDYLENRWHNLIQKKSGRNRYLSCTHVSFSGL